MFPLPVTFIQSWQAPRASLEESVGLILLPILKYYISNSNEKSSVKPLATICIHSIGCPCLGSRAQQRQGGAGKSLPPISHLKTYYQYRGNAGCVVNESHNIGGTSAKRVTSVWQNMLSHGTGEPITILHSAFWFKYIINKVLVLQTYNTIQWIHYKNIGTRRKQLLALFLKIIRDAIKRTHSFQCVIADVM